MKKLLAIVAALAIFLNIAACSSKSETSTPTTTNGTSQSEPEKPKPEPDPNIEYPISTATNKFIDAKTIAIEGLDSVSSGTQGEVQAGLFGIAMTDFFLVPLQFIDDVAMGDGEMVGYPDAAAEVKWTGFEYEFSMKYEEDGKEITVEGRYDYKTDSMAANYTMGGTTGVYFEYAKDGKGGYMSQCSIMSSDKPDTFSVMSIYFLNEDGVCGVETVTKDKLPDAIYCAVPTDPAAFIKNDEFFFQFIGGKGSVVVGGQMSEF